MSKNNSSLKKISIKQLERELNSRKSNKIAELKKEMTTIENEIIALGGNVKSESVVETLSSGNKKIARVKKSMAKTRVTNEKSLKDLLVSIADDGTTRTTNQYLSELVSRGWKSKSPKPYYVVAAALASQEKKKVFRRIAKGSYELIKG